jgi:hypothetical protein
MTIIVKIEIISIGIRNVKLYLKYKRANDDKNVKIMNNKDDCSLIYSILKYIVSIVFL